MSFSHHTSEPSSSGASAEDVNAGDADISSLLEMLGSVRDPRDARGKQHPLEFVLAVCVVATLAGAENYAQISRRARGMPQSLLRKLGGKWSWFKLRYQCPSLTVIRNVLTGIDGNLLDAITGKWLFQRARKDGKKELEFALDGKVMRGAWTDENDKVTLFSAMIHRMAITIAQVIVPSDTNEITQVGKLLEAVGIPEGESALFTMDAAHTQHETAETIAAEPGIDYLMRVKGNQPTLQRAVFDKILPLIKRPPCDVVEEYARGMIKKWSCWITSAEGIKFPYISQVGLIRRDVFEASGALIRKEIALMLTSRNEEGMTAADMNCHTRNHWGIENKSHYVRDTTYREDHCQAWTGEGPHCLASLRNLAIGLFRLKGVTAIKATTEWIAEDRMRALQFMVT